MFIVYFSLSVFDFYTVSDLPDEGPAITGTLPLYNPGETLTANCSSFNSFPSATLNWYINGQVAPKRLLVEYPVTSSRLQLYTSTLGLRYAVRYIVWEKSFTSFCLLG